MRYETREIKISKHAAKQIKVREITEYEVKSIVRAGAVHPDADCDFIAYGSIRGQHIEVACLDLGSHLLIKTAYVR